MCFVPLAAQGRRTGEDKSDGQTRQEEVVETVRPRVRHEEMWGSEQIKTCGKDGVG